MQDFTGDSRSLLARTRRRSRRVVNETPICLTVVFDIYEHEPGHGSELFGIQCSDGKPIVVESREHDRFLLDPVEHLRIRRSKCDPDAFDDAAAGAEQRELRLSVHRKQLDFVLNRKDKILAVLSGSRAGKTEALIVWLVLQWLERGYVGATFWWVAPTIEQAHIMVSKLCVSRPGNRPPVLPPELIRSYPEKTTAKVHVVELIDGSQIRLIHSQFKGENLRGFDVIAVAVDEITAIKAIENYEIALNRTIDHDGQMAIGSTPVQNHWAKPEIYDRGKEGDQGICLHEFVCFENPFITASAIRRWLQTRGANFDAPPEEQPPLVRRECFGHWITDGSAAFPDFDLQIHTRTGEHWWVDDYGQSNITAQAGASHWRRSHGYRIVGGQDFNDRGNATVICQVAGDPGDWHTWTLYAMAEYVTSGVADTAAVALVGSIKADFRHDPCPLACDATGGSKQGRGDFSTLGEMAVPTMRAYGFDALAPEYELPKGREAPTAINPKQRDSLDLMGYLFRRNQLIVHDRCRILKRGLTELERDDQGRIAKVSAPGSVTDILSDPVDCFRYVAWAIFGRLWQRETRELGRR